MDLKYVVLISMVTILTEANLGEMCSNSVTCAIASSYCDTSSSRCKCSAGYYDNNGENVAGGSCSLQGGLGATCQAGNDLSCAALYSRCSQSSPYVCVCQSGYTASGSVCVVDSAGLGESCVNPSRSCYISNSYCNGTVCICTSGYVQSGTTCVVPQAGYQDSCVNPSRTCSGNLICASSDTCQCSSGYTYSFVSASCATNTAFYGDSCVNPSRTCGTSNTYCANTGTCLCNTGYTYSLQSASCVSNTALYGQACVNPSGTCLTSNSYCGNTGTCLCNIGYTYSLQTTSCVADTAVYGQTCMNPPRTCTTSNSHCANTGTCQCNNGYTYSSTTATCITASVQGQYSVSTAKHSWRQAAEACTLATPTINFSGNKLSVELNYTLTDDVWIGYYLNKTMFEYTGCLRTGTFEYRNVSMNSPGYCLSSCGTRNPRYIGLSKDKCFCLNETNGTLSEESEDCGDECPGEETKVACGSSTSMSLYKVVHGSIYGGSGDCLRLERQDSGIIYMWDSCHKDLQILCTQENKTVTYVEPSGGRDNFPWIEALKTCFEGNITPSTLENAKSVTGKGGPAWIGVLRSVTIYTYESLQLIGDDFACVARPNNELKFESNEHEKRFLCNRDTATSTMESVTQGGSTPTTTRNPDGPSESTFTSENFTTIAILVVDSGNQEKNIGLPVGVSVAVVLVVGIVIAFIMIRRRRTLNTPKSDIATKNGRLSEEKSNNYPDITGTKHTNGNNGHNNPMRFSKLESQDNYDHTYHVLEKDHNIETGPEQTESHYNYPDMTDLIEQNLNNQWKDLGHGEHAHTYSVLEKHQKDVDSTDETYNVTGAHKPKTGQETDNVYNTLDNKNHATYDHIPGSATDKKGSDSTYDSKENVIRVLKPGGGQGSVYNHVSSVEDSGTYDHVNNVASEAKSAENDYS